MTDLAKLSPYIFVELYREQFAVEWIEATVTNIPQVLNDDAPWSNFHKNGGLYHRNSVVSPTPCRRRRMMSGSFKHGVKYLLCQGQHIPP